MLTQKQEMFCREIVLGKTASDAYRAAYSYLKMKPATVNRRAKDLMDNGKIKARIDELLKPAIEAAQIKAQDVLETIARLSKKAEMAEKFNDALKGQELLGRHLKLFTDKTELTGKDGNPIDTRWIVEVQKADNAKD